MKKVLYITDYVDIGGGESSLLNIMLFFKRNTILEPILLVPSTGEITEFCERYSLTYIVFPFNRFKRSWVKWIPLINPIASLKFMSIIKKYKIDLVHVNSVGSSLVNSLIPSFLTETKLVWTCHGWWEKPYGARARLLNIFVEKVFAVSNYVKSYIEFPEEKVVTNYLGIDLNRFKNNKDEIECPINKGERIVGMIGRYQPVKGQHLFVDVAEEILKNPGYKDVSFMLVGDVNFSKEYNNYKKNIIEKINSSKFKENFILQGFEKDIEKYYKKIDVLVIPSEFESFSMVTLEGLASGLMVIATDKGGPSEIIEHKKSGLLFKSGNRKDLYKKIIYGLNNNKEYAKDAEKRAEEFSVEKIGLDYLSEYNKVWGD